MDAKQTNEIKQIHSEYRTRLNPLIQAYEVLKKTFPITILNEIRDVFSHISKCYKPKISADEINSNIEKAKNHLRRAMLDAYKYNCMAMQDKIAEFKKEHERVLSLIDTGAFIDKLFADENEAQNLFLKAKEVECECNDIEDCFGLFQEAYNKYYEIYKFIQSKRVDGSKLNALVDKDYKRKLKVSIIWNIVMGIVSVASLIFGIIGVVT